MPSRLPSPSAEGKRAYPTPTAPSLLETMWSRLDEITAELIRDFTGAKAPEDNVHENGTDCISTERLGWECDYSDLRGEARGVAWCISVIQSPYSPDVDAVRAEAMVRYKANKRG